MVVAKMIFLVTCLIIYTCVVFFLVLRKINLINHYSVTDGAPVHCCLETENTKRRQMELIDAGLMFNCPYPPLLRKERSVDIILSFDFSARERDEERPFKVAKQADSVAFYLH